MSGVTGEAGGTGAPDEAVGADTHGSGASSAPGDSDVDSEDGAEDGAEGADELTDGVGGLTGGSVFWSLPPVSPLWRWNQSPRSGS